MALGVMRSNLDSGVDEYRVNRAPLQKSFHFITGRHAMSLAMSVGERREPNRAVAKLPFPYVAICVDGQTKAWRSGLPASRIGV